MDINVTMEIEGCDGMSWYNDRLVQSVSCHGGGGHNQCWAKFVAPTGNFPAAYDPNQKLKILTGHFPMSDNVNRNMLKKIFTTYQIFLAYA